jgi:hypothetical protein
MKLSCSLTDGFSLVCTTACQCAEGDPCQTRRCLNVGTAKGGRRRTSLGSESPGITGIRVLASGRAVGRSRAPDGFSRSCLQSAAHEPEPCPSLTATLSLPHHDDDDDGLDAQAPSHIPEALFSVVDAANSVLPKVRLTRELDPTRPEQSPLPRIRLDTPSSNALSFVLSASRHALVVPPPSVQPSVCTRVLCCYIPPWW